MSAYGVADPNFRGAFRASRAWRIAIGAVPIIALVIAWDVVARTWLSDGLILPPPAEVGREAADMLRTGELARHISASMGAILTALFIAIAIAIPAGLVAGGIRSVGLAFGPLTHAFSQVNPFTLWPVFLMLLGFGEANQVAMVLWVAVWPVYFGTVSGMKSVDPYLVKMARSVGCDRYDVFLKITLPSAAPAIFSGLRFTVLLSFFVLIGSEMIGASSGLGYLVNYSCPWHGAPQLGKMWTGIVTITLLGALMSGLVVWLERKVTGWNRIEGQE